MAHHKIQINTGDTLVVESPVNPNEYDEMTDIIRGSTGVQLITEKGRTVHLCQTDEICCVIDMLKSIESGDADWFQRPYEED